MCFLFVEACREKTDFAAERECYPPARAAAGTARPGGHEIGAAADRFDADLSPPREHGKSLVARASNGS